MAGYVVVRLPLAATEALSDGQEGQAEGWPDAPDHAEAFTAALAAVTAALDDKPEHDDCLRRLAYAVDVADHALHSTLLRAARQPGTNFLSSATGCMPSMAAMSSGRRTQGRRAGPVPGLPNPCLHLDRRSERRLPASVL